MVSLDDRILMNEVYIFDVGRTHVYVRYDNISIYVFIPVPTYLLCRFADMCQSFLHL